MTLNNNRHESASLYFQRNQNIIFFFILKHENALR